jgi:hypothetical protein
MNFVLGSPPPTLECSTHKIILIAPSLSMAQPASVIYEGQDDGRYFTFQTKNFLKKTGKTTLGYLFQGNFGKSLYEYTRNDRIFREAFGLFEEQKQRKNHRQNYSLRCTNFAIFVQ